MPCRSALQEISRAINGDKKVEVNPIFKVYVVLDANSKAEHRPTTKALGEMVNFISKELITVLKVIPRLVDVVEEEVSARWGGEGRVFARSQGYWLVLTGALVVLTAKRRRSHCGAVYCS